MVSIAQPTAIGPTLHQLNSGVTAIVEQMPVEAISFSLWVNAGSANEPDDWNGMAHFLEHMVFKGTQTLASGDFERQVEARGAIANAATSQDYTQYYLTCSPRDFADLAPLQVEVVTQPRLPAEEFERERLVVLEEIRRSQDSPQRRAFQQAMELAFATLPYRRPILGPSPIVERLTPYQMREFHAQHYRPDTISAVAVGNLPVDRLLEILETGFKTASALTSSKAEAFPQARQSGNRSSTNNAVVKADMAGEAPFQVIERLESTDPRLQQARLTLLWRVPGSDNWQEACCLDVLAAILTQGRTSRLVRELREERGWVSRISASNMTYRHQGIFSISAQLDESRVPEVESVILDRIRDLQSQPVEVAELERVRTRVANGFIFGNESPQNRSSLYGYYHALSGALETALYYPRTIAQISPAELQATAARFLSDRAYGMSICHPTARSV